MRIRGGWKWFWNMFNGMFDISNAEPSDCAITVLMPTGSCVLHLQVMK